VKLLGIIASAIGEVGKSKQAITALKYIESGYKKNDAR